MRGLVVECGGQVINGVGSVGRLGQLLRSNASCRAKHVSSEGPSRQCDPERQPFFFLNSKRRTMTVATTKLTCRVRAYLPFDCDVMLTHTAWHGGHCQVIVAMVVALL
jgi:hypothetical protein